MEEQRKSMEEKRILSTLEEKINRRHTALLIIDMQHDYCSPCGEAEKAGRPIERCLEVVPALKTVLEQARSSRVLIVHGITTTLPGGLSDSPVWLEQRTRSTYATDKMCIEGSWGEQILPELVPRDGEIVIKKYRYSCFEGTPLEILLRANGVQTLVIGGVSTNTCVDSTLRYAFHRDFYVVLMEDCVNSYRQDLHKATLEEVPIRFGVVTDSKTVCNIWQNASS